MAVVRLRCSLSGPSGSWGAGAEYRCSDAEAERLVDAGHAELLSEESERATAPAAAERATADRKVATKATKAKRKTKRK